MDNTVDERLVKGIEEFNRGLFFECHETLEEIWLEDRGDDRLFYQGIIQIAAAYFKWEQNVPMGTLKLMRSGLEKLSSYGPVHLGVDLKSFKETVQAQLLKVEAFTRHGTEPPSLQPPHLTLDTGNGTG